MKNQLLIYLSFLCSSIIFGQETIQKDTLKKIKNEIQIKTKRNDISKKTGEEVIDKCELGKLACCNLAESFENSNTVDVNYSDGVTGGREIQMLGLAGVYSQQLIEGMPYQRGILGKIGLELVPGPWIDNIGINKGIGSVVNGFENITGQINIDFVKPKKSLNWLATGYISEIAKTDINLIKGWKLNEKLYTSILAHTSFSHATMDNNQDGFTDMPIFRNYNLMNRWHYNADNGFVLQAMVQGVRYENEAGQILDHSNHHNSNHYVINQNTNSLQGMLKAGWELDAVKVSSFALLGRINYASQDGFLSQKQIDNHQIYGNITAIYQSNLNEHDHFKYKLGTSHIYNLETERLDTLNFRKEEIIHGGFGEITIKNKEETMTAIIGIRGDIHQKLGLFVSPRASLVFNPTKAHVLKLSAGLGFRTPTYLTEAFGYLISNRQVELPKELKAEKAMNAGISYKHNYKLLGNECWIEGSYFLTLFQNQMLLNLETPELLKIEYIIDQSRAQNFQIENQFQFTKNWSLKLSYKNDQTIANFNGIQKNIPLLKNDKFLANLYWTSTNKKYRVSTTFLLNSQSRIPTLTTKQETYSPVYPIVHGQFNYVPNDKLELYIGSENIFSYTQHDRIQSANNVNSSSFDAGMIWGPMDMRRMYIGVKASF